MTDLRFLGDWRLWQGLIVGIIAAGSVWWLYRREVGNREDSSRWLLPATRSLAVFLLIMMLTGPVLHRTRMVGELLRLLVVVDSSESMSVGDKDMAPGRKLMIAGKLGLVDPDVVDVRLVKAADSLERSRKIATETIDAGEAADLAAAVKTFADEIEEAHEHIGKAKEKTAVALAEKGTILREYWTDIGGGDIPSMTNSKDYPDKPKGKSHLTSFEAPANFGDNYGTRVRGYIHPPISGDYTFWIAGDDNCELWLSTSDSVAGKKLVARVPNWTSPNNWDADQNQKSAKIALAAGRTYYIEALHKESVGGDHVSVGWELPDGRMERPIPGSYLSPYTPAEEELKRGDVKAAIARFEEGLVEPTKLLRKLKPDSDGKKILEELGKLASAAASWENGLRESFEDSASRVVKSDDPKIREGIKKFDELTRWQRLQLLLLGERSDVLKKLASKHDVQLVALKEKKPDVLWESRAGRDDKAGKLPEMFTTPPDGKFTDLSVGLKTDGKQEGESGGAGQKDEPSQRTAVLLFSDGLHNDGESPVHQSKVQGNRGVRIFTVGIGAKEPPEDIAVAKVEAPARVFYKDNVKGKIELNDNMKPGKPFVLKVMCNEQMLWEKRLTTDETGLRSIEYDFPVKDLVEKEMTKDDDDVRHLNMPLHMSAEISDIEDDRETENNHSPFRVLAVIQKNKVMLVESRPRWEWRYLRNLFERDEQWEVNSVLTDGTSLKRGKEPGDFPEDREELLSYDLVVFGEVPARLLEKEELEWFKDFVQDRAGGMVFIDGRRNELHSYADSPFKELLPVEWVEGGAVRNSTEVKLTEQGKALGAMDLSSDGDPNEATWAALKAPRWVAPVKALPGSETLLECVVADENVPGIVFRRSGAGQVLYTSFDELWRWRYRVGDKYHRRFWQQMAVYIMETPFAVRDKRVSLDPGAMAYRPGEYASIRARLRDEKGKPMKKADAKVLLYRDGKQIASFPMTADERGGGLFSARTGALEEGAYEVRLKVKGIPDEHIKASGGFVVEGPKVGELAELNCDEVLLSQLAENANGRMFKEEYIDEIVKELEPLSKGKLVETNTVLWQSYWWLVAVVGLLTVEWAYRKVRGMI